MIKKLLKYTLRFLLFLAGQVTILVMASIFPVAVLLIKIKNTMNLLQVKVELWKVIIAFLLLSFLCLLILKIHSSIKPHSNKKVKKLSILCGNPLLVKKYTSLYLSVKWDEKGDMYCFKCDNPLIPNVTVGIDDKSNKSNFRCSKCGEIHFLKNDNGELITKEIASKMWFEHKKNEGEKQSKALASLVKFELKK